MKSVQWLVAAVVFLFVLVGCSDVSVHPDPTPQLAGEIDSAAVAVSSADGHLSRVPAEVPEARKDLTGASSHLAAAKVQTSAVSKAFQAEASGRAKAEAKVKELEESYLSPRQKKQIWWIVFTAVAIGVAYVLSKGGVWWLAWVVPLVHTVLRMFITGFVPEVAWIVGWVIGLLRKKPEASAGSEIFPQASNVEALPALAK